MGYVVFRLRSAAWKAVLSMGGTSTAHDGVAARAVAMPALTVAAVLSQVAALCACCCAVVRVGICASCARFFAVKFMGGLRMKATQEAVQRQRRTHFSRARRASHQASYRLQAGFAVQLVQLDVMPRADDVGAVEAVDADVGMNTAAGCCTRC